MYKGECGALLTHSPHSNSGEQESVRRGLAGRAPLRVRTTPRRPLVPSHAPSLSAPPLPDVRSRPLTDAYPLDLLISHYLTTPTPPGPNCNPDFWDSLRRHPPPRIFARRDIFAQLRPTFPSASPSLLLSHSIFSDITPGLPSTILSDRRLKRTSYLSFDRPSISAPPLSPSLS